mgnify:FL=1
MERTTRQAGSRAGKVKKGFCRLVAERTDHFKALGKHKTAGNYSCALKHFMQFRQEKDIALEELTSGTMKDFQTHLIGKGLKMNTISLYNRILKAVYNYALDEEIIQEDKRPFRKVFTGAEKTRKRTLGKEALKKIVRADLRGDASREFARDMFLFSIYMQGMAFVDIAHLRKSQIKNRCLVYRRSKTNQCLKIVIQPCAREIIEKWMVDDKECPYLFPILYNPLKKQEVRYDTALRTQNKRLERLASRLGMEEPFSSYVARHTWASLAKWSGVNDTVICEAMGHNNPATTSIYLASLDPDVIAAANRKTLSVFMKWRI